MKEKIKEITNVTVLSAILLAVGYYFLGRITYIGFLIFLLGFLPLIAARLNRLEMKRMIPDMVFGAIDTGLLTIPAIIGAKLFGALGAVVGGVIGDAVTDAIAGFFEGSVAQWLRSKNIEESRLPLSSALGKMSGCLLGAGFVLSLAHIIGIKI